MNGDRTIVIHTDGSCSLRSGRGGWAFVARCGDHSASRHGFEADTTISRMELTAILRALQFIRPGGPEPVEVVSDSQYAVNCARKWIARWVAHGWTTSTGTAVKNTDLLVQVHRATLAHEETRPVRFRWVRGHSGDRGNELADALAGNARRDFVTDWNGKADDKLAGRGAGEQRGTGRHGKHDTAVVRVR